MSCIQLMDIILTILTMNPELFGTTQSYVCTKHEACWDEATQKRFLLQCNYRTGFQGSRCKNAEYYLKSLRPGSQIETSIFASALNMWRSVESAALFHF